MSLSTFVRSVFKPLACVVFAAVLLSSLPSTPLRAQDVLTRKVKSRVAPIYPDIARRMNLGGVVKLEVTVAANGAVKETKVIGGNPILVNAAVEAVEKWRFEAATEETTGVVEFKFDPSMN